jgi:hypothetical protein
VKEDLGTGSHGIEYREVRLRDTSWQLNKKGFNPIANQVHMLMMWLHFKASLSLPYGSSFTDLRVPLD